MLYVLGRKLHVLSLAGGVGLARETNMYYLSYDTTQVLTCYWICVLIWSSFDSVYCLLVSNTAEKTTHAHVSLQP